MTTNFPTSVDAFTNPTSNDTLDNPPHDQQHADINDAMEAVQTSLLDGSPLKIDDANNRVGIGTASPADTFEVSGTSVFDDIHSDSIANWNFAQAEFVRKASNLPNSKVVSVMLDGDSISSTDLYSNVNFILHTDSAPTTGSTSTGLNAGLGINAPDTVRFGTSSAERMRIDSNGNVGIGTNSPSELLDINAGTAGSVELSTTGGRTIQLTANDAEPYLSVGSTTPHSAAIMTNGVRRLTVDSAGDVGIGTINPLNQFEVYNGTYYSIIGRKDWGLRSTGTYALTTSGGANVYISTNGTFYRSTSSGKYKTDVEDMNTDAADVVFALRPVWFRSTSPHDPEGWSYYGLIAEEVAEVDPRLVSFGAREDCGCDADADHVAECLTEPEGVYYDRLVPHLINVMQRQQEQIDALTARIEALEAG